MNEIVGQSASEIARRVSRREIKAAEVVRAHLDRIAAAEPRVDAFLLVTADRAIERARSLDASNDLATLALAGVPVAVKDVFDIEGLPTTCGSKILEGYRPPFTASVVRRLEQAGAIVIGKTNMDEFAMGSSTENSAYKKTRNPWDATRVPGGSSGGSAAAVAAGMAPIALGTDTGGSIRQPAGFCGVVGLKPTYGRVSRYGLVAFASSLDQAGPVARDVNDAALVLSVISGHDPADSTSAARPPFQVEASRQTNLAGLRIGVPRAFLASGLDASVAASFQGALADLEKLGAAVVEIALPHAPHAIAAYYIVATAEASSNLARFDGVRYGARRDGKNLADMYGRTRDTGFGPEVKRRILLGTFALSSGYYDAYYRRAQQVRTLIRRDFESALETCDAVAMPTSPTPAFRLGEKTDDPLQMYLADVFTVPANLAGIPALSIPSAPAAGLPIGFQLLGRPFEEATLLRIGATYQEATAYHLAQAVV